jgi:hypothetical protein
MASRFWVGGTGTWDAADTTHWAATSGGAGGQSVPGASDTVTFDASSGAGTVTVNGNITLAATVPAFTIGAFGGTIDFATNNNNISAGGFSVTGSGTRTLNMGSGTWTATGVAGTVWDKSSSSGFTFNANTSTILLSAVPTGARTLILGSSTTYNNITVTNAAQSPLNIDLSATTAATIANLTLTNVLQVRLSSAVNYTISGALTYNGNSTKQGILYSTGLAVTLTVANATVLDYIAIQSVTKAGAGSITVTNGFDAGGNTGVTITLPSGGVVGVIGS